MPRDDAAEKLGATQKSSAPRPILKVEPGMLDVIATQAEQAIIGAGLPVFQHGGRLVRPATQEVTASKGRTTLAACFVELAQASALDRLCRAAEWRRHDKKKNQEVAIDPPRQIADVLLSRTGEWRFPHVSGIITTPTLRPDHSILRKPGYDAATRLYLVADPALAVLPIPNSPNREDAEEALKQLDALLGNFPFVSPTDRSVAISALLTPICRGAMSVAPLHAFRANTAGTGKSYLADLASALATGRPCPVVAAGRDDDETDKRLIALLLSGFPLLSIDNVNGELYSDVLAQAIERPLLRLRPLGSSKIVEVENQATVFANGNGLRVRSDMTRRTLYSDLDAQEERPELRSFDFDPVERVLGDRPRYVAAALTVVRAFALSGARPDLAPLASFADYTTTVRGSLVWLGRPDPVLSMEQARDEDPELSELREIMILWERHIGLNIETAAKALVQIADQRERDDNGHQLSDYANGELRDALFAVAGGRNGIDGLRFGNWLRSRKGRVVTVQLPRSRSERVRFEQRGHSAGVARWCLKTLPAKVGW